MTSEYLVLPAVTIPQGGTSELFIDQQVKRFNELILLLDSLEEPLNQVISYRLKALWY